MALHSDLEVGELIWFGGDVHLYKNHLEQAKLQLTRKPYPLPKLNILKKRTSLEEYEVKDFALEKYQYHSRLIE